MSNDISDVAESMRSMADLIETHGDNFSPIIERVFGDDDETVEIEEAGEEQPLAEIHELDEGFLIVAEMKKKEVSEVSVVRKDQGIAILTQDDAIDAQIEEEIDMSSMTLQINNGVLQVSVSKVN